MASGSALRADLRTARIPHIIELLRHQTLPAEVLLPRLNTILRAAKIPEISLRTVQLDLECVLKTFGAAGIERVPKSALHPEPTAEFHRYRMFYRLVGAENLIPITHAVLYVTEMEALALLAAKAQLATPSMTEKAGRQRGHEVGEGPLSDALGTLIKRLGLGYKDGRIPDILAVALAAPEPYDPTHLLAALRAIRLGDALTMDYQTPGKPQRVVVVQPIRLSLAEGEPYLWAWEGEVKKLKTYKVARIRSVTARNGLDNVPSGLDTEVRTLLADGFRGVSGPAQRGRVVVRLSVAGVPYIKNRRLGSNQLWEDLPGGEARLSFTTSGIDAVKYWLLQCGASAVIESPASLVAWYRTETKRMAEAYEAH